MVTLASLKDKNVETPAEMPVVDTEAVDTEAVDTAEKPKKGTKKKTSKE